MVRPFSVFHTVVHTTQPGYRTDTDILNVYHTVTGTGGPTETAPNLLHRATDQSGVRSTRDARV